MNPITLSRDDFETIRHALASAQGWLESAPGDDEWASKYAAKCEKALTILHHRYAESVGVKA